MAQGRTHRPLCFPEPSGSVPRNGARSAFSQCGDKPRPYPRGEPVWEDADHASALGRRRFFHRLSRGLIIPFLVLFVAAHVREGVPAAEPSRNPYEVVPRDCRLQFPQDHGEHPGFQTEWWYYTGNVRSASGERFGFQLTFFRRQIAPSSERDRWPHPASAWRTQQVYVAHAALSELTAGRFHQGEAVSRGAVGLAGVKQAAGETRVFLGNWETRITGESHQLTAFTPDFDLHLNLAPHKPPVLHGDAGYSLKGSTPEKASCYYSFTRMGVSGSLKVAGRVIPVSGSAWMDHEFSSAPLEAVYVGWDWFSLQLDDDTELMLYCMRKKDGSFGIPSSGTFVDASGKSTRLRRDDFQVDSLDSWKSPHSGATYPSRWRLRVHPLQADLEVESNLSDQELRTGESTQVTYWEGSVSGRGTRLEKPVEVTGYVELTGYAHPIEALH
ncbi:MAG: carotenoid 1,2-hydratase [Deltaproteobacteria bacterium]|nr:carotenoid 1,2-hydratase [Deltaproteobacteria bacterium]